MLVQLQRIADARNLSAAFMQPFTALRPGCQRVALSEIQLPAEGWLSKEEEERCLDPLGIDRLRKTVAWTSDTQHAMQDLANELAPKLRGVLLQPETCLNQAERIPLPNGGKVRIVNKVCTVYAGVINEGERSLDVDEDSEYAEKKQSPEEAARFSKQARRISRVGARMSQVEAQFDAVEELPVVDGAVSSNTPTATRVMAAPPAKGKGGKHQQPPSELSLRGLQQKWLTLGYNKNSVGTALSIRYCQPWTSTHLAFTTNRIFSTGSNNRHASPHNPGSCGMCVSVCI
jgi:hypothetical protein